MTRFLIILLVTIIILTFGQYFSEAKHVKKKQKKHPHVVVVVGKVYCDTCFQGVSDKTGHFISGASVAVECKYGASVDPIFRGEAKTDEHGEFRVRLPSSVSKHTKRIEGCSVRLVKSGESYCAVASSATTTSSSIHLRSRRHGTRVFSAGFFTFRPLNQPSLCNQKPITRLENSLHVPDLSPFPPPLKDPTTPGDLPPLPSLPIPNIPLPSLPNLPPLPALPRLPSLPGNLPPIITKTQKLAENNDDQNIDARQFFFPPNPFQPPPLIPNPFQPPPAPLIPNPFQPPPAPLIPNPLQPPPAPTPLFPNPFQPPPAPPAPFFPLPTIPGLTPSPPPPSPPAFPFPFPPFPFRPPGSPGTPPPP